MKRVLSRIRRLHAMSKAEISHRMYQSFCKQADKFRFFVGLGAEDHELDNLIATHGGSLRNYIQSVASQRFYASLAPEQRQATVELIAQIVPSFKEQCFEQAARLCSHRLNLLAYPDISLGHNIDWHRDPVSGHRWNKRFFASYDPVQSGSADPKIIHELNRQQHLPRLAKAFLVTGNEEFAGEAVSQIESWIEQNDRWNGVNWHSSFEIAIRVLSWLWTLFMLSSSDALDEKTLQRITRSLFSQIDQVSRYLSTYSSPNTHLLGEATALFIAGLIFEELPRAARWREQGAALLVDCMAQQILNDGVYFELSSYYHCYATDFFLQAMVLARRHRSPLPSWMWSRLNQMIEFIAHLTRPDGTLPLIGDDDGGRALALASDHYGCYIDALSNGAVLFERGDLKYLSRGLVEETLWLFGPEAFAVFNSLPVQPPNRLNYACPDAGYFLQRSGWDGGATCVIFDCGKHGLASGGHAHADALSIGLFSGGTELLIDPGTSVFNGASEWRRFFRSTHAHNTVVVDHRDQSVQGATFQWSTQAHSRVLKHLALEDLEFVEGEHDGYTRLPHPITHKRRLLNVQSKYWIVSDDLKGQNEHTFDFMYHFAPGTKLFVLGEEQNGEIECRARLNQATLQMALYATAPMHAEVLCGQVEPIQGWASTRYGERKPASVFKGTIRSFAPVVALSVLMPGHDPNLRTRRLTISGGRAISAAVGEGAIEDICVASVDTSAELRLRDFTMTGDFFWIRTENGVLRRLLAINAFSFAISGNVIFRENSPLSHVMVHAWDNGMVIERGEEEGKVYVRDLRDRQFQSN